MTFGKSLVFAGLLSISAPVFGKAHCRGSATSLPLRLIQNSLFVTSIKVNGTGPYDFLVDTGAQVNTIDDALATRLHLIPEKAVGVIGASTYSRNALVLIDLTASGKTIASSPTVVTDAAQLRTIDDRIRGILGETFLEHFDFLLDNENRLLCLDDTGTMSLSLNGQKIPLAEPIAMQGSTIPFTRPLVISSSLSGFDNPRILLLDSGSNSPLLFPDRPHIPRAIAKPQRILKRVVSGVEQAFITLPPQEVRIGESVLRKIEFAMPVNSVGGKSLMPQEDGVLPTIAYRRVFISPSKGYVLLYPWN